MNDLAPVQSFISIVEKVATDPSVDVDKMKAILDMQERVMERQAEQAYAHALNAVQADLPTVQRKSYNAQTQSYYAELDALYKALIPVYTAQGFSLSFGEDDSPKEDHIRITVEVSHVDGCTKQRHVDLPIDNKGIAGKKNKTDLHGTASTFQYGRRYLTLMVFNIATTLDDDGNQGDVALVTESQVNDLQQLAVEVKADIPKLLKHYKINALDEMPAAAYKQAMKALERKRA